MASLERKVFNAYEISGNERFFMVSGRVFSSIFFCGKRFNDVWCVILAKNHSKHWENT